MDKSTPAVFLIHGLGGTQYDLGSMHKRLKNAGFVTHSLTLPGHGTTPEDLVHVTAEQWMEAVTAKYHEVAAQHDNFHIMGMCMGALLATELAKRQKHTRGKLIALAPPIYIDGWATAWYTPARHLMYYVPGVPARMKVEEEDPSASRTSSCAPSSRPSSRAAKTSTTAGCRWPACARSTACAAGS